MKKQRNSFALTILNINGINFEIVWNHHCLMVFKNTKMTMANSSRIVKGAYKLFKNLVPELFIYLFIDILTGIQSHLIGGINGCPCRKEIITITFIKLTIL